MYIYFVKAEELPRIKIGIAKNITRRLNDLFVGSPTNLYLYGFVRFYSREDAHQEEQKLHKTIRELHYRGEWFYFTSRLEEFITGYILGQPIDVCECESWIYNKGEKKCFSCLTRDKTSNEKLLSDLFGGLPPLLVPAKFKKPRRIKRRRPTICRKGHDLTDPANLVLSRYNGYNKKGCKTCIYETRKRRADLIKREFEEKLGEKIQFSAAPFARIASSIGHAS